MPTTEPEFETVSPAEAEAAEREALAAAARRAAEREERAAGEAADAERAAEADAAANADAITQAQNADAQADPAHVILNSAYFNGVSGEFDGEAWFDSVFKPLDSAIKSSKSMDDMALNLLFASVESIGNLIINPIKQYDEDLKKRMQAGKENRAKHFQDKVSGHPELMNKAAQYFQKWAINGGQFTSLRGTREFTSEMKAQVQAYHFITSLPRTDDGRLNWAGMKKHERAAYATALRGFIMKNKEFQAVAARDFQLILNKEELKKIYDGAAQQHPTIFRVTGSMQDARVTIDGRPTTADSVTPAEEAAAHRAATAAHSARGRDATATRDDIADARGTGRGRTPTRPTGRER